MGNSSTPQTQTTTQELSPEQRQLMNLAMPGVTKYAAQTPQRYQGSTVAGFDPSQVAGQEGALGSADVQTQLGRGGAGTTLDWLDPSKLDVSSSPVVQQNVKAATDPIWQNLSRVALPGVRDSAERSGNFGSSRQGIAEAGAIEGAARAAGQAAAPIVSAAYNTNVDAQLKALGLLPQTTSTQTVGDYTTSNVGDVRQAMEQAKINEAVGNFNWDQMAPYLQSKDIMSLLTGLPGGSTTTVASTPQQNRLTSSLGGAASGAALGSALFPGVGTAAGAGIGALLPFLG